MKIIRQNSEELIIKDGNFAWIAGSIFFIIGIIIIWKPYFLNSEIPWWVGLFVIMLGLLSVIFPTSDTIVFSKKENVLKIQRKNLVGLKKEEYPLDKINTIELRSFSSGRNEALQYRLVCLGENNKEIILNPNKSTSSRFSLGSFSFNVIPEKKIGQEIALFLEVPFSDDRRPPTVNETLNKIIEVNQNFKNKI